MANLTEDELREMLDKARADETERCVLLCKMRAEISRASAARMRKSGSYTVRAIWPPFRKVTYVAPKWEQRAQDLDAFAEAMEVVADCIRKGYDPRDLKRSDPIPPPLPEHGKYSPGDEVGGYGFREPIRPGD